MTSFPRNNRTFQILEAAKRDGYAVGAFNCYNEDGVIAVIRAAEAAKSPALIQLFPWTLRFQGPHFVRYVVAAAHAANVPMAVHLDHCIEPEDIRLGLTLPFDSIMIDASLKDTAENIEHCKDIIQIANARGIAIEAEMGRIEGGEDGLPTVELETVMTDALTAALFVEKTGVQFLAPSFGNIHGSYGSVGAEKSWNLKLLKEVHDAVPKIPLVLHGTHEISDDLFVKSRAAGMTKINLNRTVRDNYTDFVSERAGSLELTVLKMRAVEVYAKSIIRVMEGFLDSAGRADRAYLPLN